MRVRFNLSVNGSEANAMFGEYKSEVKWDFPALPREGDFIDSGILEDAYEAPVAEDMDRFMWSVDLIEWMKDDKGILPIMWLTGE